MKPAGPPLSYNLVLDKLDGDVPKQLEIIYWNTKNTDMEFLSRDYKITSNNISLIES